MISCIEGLFIFPTVRRTYVTATRVSFFQAHSIQIPETAMDAFVDAPLRRRNSDASSDRELEEEGLPPDVSNHFGFSSPPHEAFSPTHSTGHMTPGHVVGKPLHDSPKREHVQLPPDVGDNNQNLPDIVNKVRS